MSDQLPTPNVPGANPLAGGLNVLVSMPETLEIRMVDASSLGDYEIWLGVASFMMSFFSGFVVATVQAPANSPSVPLLTTISTLFGVMMAVAFVMAFAKRRRISNKSTKVSFKAVSAAVEQR
jgi:formate-dependent nitrite reductase membrane component NrfD